MAVKPPPFQVSGWDDFAHPGAVALIGHPAVHDAYAKQRAWEAVAPIARDASLNAEDCWRAVKFLRWTNREQLPLVATDGQPFSWIRLGLLDRVAHEVDRATGGGGASVFDSDEGLLRDPDSQARIKIRSLMDEAMESSIMEGAAVTRDQARDVLRSGRPPANKHERMVVNNYQAMVRLRVLKARPLSVEMLLELHVILTEGTWEPGDEHKQGRLRRSNEDICVEDVRSGEVVFVPPPAATLPQRLERLCAFANDPATGPRFMHPLVRACLLHFFIGYEHPFCDGNGRTARAVFYWFALRNGYDLFEYLTISEVIRRAWAQYAAAYRHVELDGGDTTYFLAFHFDAIRQSMDRLTRHIDVESRRMKKALALVAASRHFNLRQRLLLEHALRHSDTVYTVAEHQHSYGIAVNTARSDLEGLVRAGYLATSKAGKAITYHLSPTGLRRLRKASGAS